MYKFDKNSKNIILIMYPTGGYGNFLYYLLTEYFSNTVKVLNDFQFSSNGNSHQVKKYTQPFLLGLHYKNIQSFKYDYTVSDKESYDQISSGKKLVVLCDTGNLVDTIKIPQSYFPNASIIRCYAQSFDEKLVVWANCITKSGVKDIYPGSLHTKEGIAKFKNKQINEITDQDAIDCLINFFKNDFEKFGKFYTSPSNKLSVFDLPIKHFFTKDSLIKSITICAKWLNTEIQQPDKLEKIVDEFISLQKNFNLLDLSFDDGSIVCQAIKLWRQKQ